VGRCVFGLAPVSEFEVDLRPSAVMATVLAAGVWMRWGQFVSRHASHPDRPGPRRCAGRGRYRRRPRADPSGGSLMPSHTHLLRIRCGGCAATWAGADRAHCASCHRTFDTVPLWDTHRADGRCVHPRQLNLIATKNHIWLEPLALVPQQTRLSK
jgi:hypothetical protein